MPPLYLVPTRIQTFFGFHPIATDGFWRNASCSWTRRRRPNIPPKHCSAAVLKMRSRHRASTLNGTRSLAAVTLILSPLKCLGGLTGVVAEDLDHRVDHCSDRILDFAPSLQTPTDV